MAKVDDLRSKYSDLNISMFDILNTIDETPTKKYLEMFCKISRDYLIGRSSSESTDQAENVINGFVTMVKGAMLHNRDKNKVILDYLKLFIEHNDGGCIENNDVQRYSKFLQIEKSVDVAEEKKKQLELEKQVVKFHEDDEWLIIQPLNLKSSQKYGNTTKWCTVMTNERFVQYTIGNNILIYVINKKTDNRKVAIQRTSLSAEPTFWDSKDKSRSMWYMIKENILDPKIIEIIMNSLKEVKPINQQSISLDKQETQTDNTVLGVSLEQLKTYIGNEYPYTDQYNQVRSTDYKWKRKVRDDGAIWGYSDRYGSDRYMDDID